MVYLHYSGYVHLQDKDGSGNPSSLNLQNVGGVFVVLMAGLFVSCFVALFELLYAVYETSQREKVSVCVCVGMHSA
jgi:hypothetical protein